VGAAREFGEIRRLHRRRRVDHEISDVARYPHLETAGHRYIALAGSDAVDLRPLFRTIPQPAQRRALRIEIH